MLVIQLQRALSVPDRACALYNVVVVEGEVY